MTVEKCLTSLAIVEMGFIIYSDSMSSQSKWLLLRKQKTTNAGSLYTVGGNVNWSSNYENYQGGSSDI